MGRASTNLNMDIFPRLIRPWFFLLCFGVIGLPLVNGRTFTMDLQMPNITTYRKDMNLCVVLEIPDDELYITGSEVVGNLENIHHIQLAKHTKSEQEEGTAFYCSPVSTPLDDELAVFKKGRQAYGQSYVVSGYMRGLSHVL